MTISARVGKYSVDVESMADISALRELADVLESEMLRKSAEANNARRVIEKAILDYVAQFGKLEITAIDPNTGEVTSEFEIDDGSDAYAH